MFAKYNVSFLDEKIAKIYIVTPPIIHKSSPKTLYCKYKGKFTNDLS